MYVYMYATETKVFKEYIIRMFQLGNYLLGSFEMNDRQLEPTLDEPRTSLFALPTEHPLIPCPLSPRVTFGPRSTQHIAPNSSAIPQIRDSSGGLESITWMKYKAHPARTFCLISFEYQPYIGNINL